MKYLNKILLATVLLSAASCTEYNMKDFLVDEPESLAQLEYLKDYNALKTYVDRTANPNFKLGTGASLSDYNSKGLMYRLVNANYDEMTMGYEMKHGAIVQADGSLLLDNVKTLITNAKEAGTTIYGHTLCWHSNQNAAYLNGLIAPIVIKEPSFPNTLDLAGLKNATFTGWTKTGNVTIESTSGMGAGAAVKCVNGTGTTGTDLQLSSPTMTVVQGHTYQVIMYIKSDAKGQGKMTFEGLKNNSPSIDWFGTGTASETFETGLGWKAVKFTVKDFTGTSFKVNLNLGYTAGVTYYIDVKNFYVYDTQGDPIITNLITNGDFETGAATGWGGWGNGSTNGISAKGEGYGGSGYCFKVTNPSKTSGYWGVQTVYNFAQALTKGDTYIMSFWVKGTAAGTIRPELQSTDYSSNGFGQVSVTTDWQKVELSVTATTDTRTRFIISYGEFAGTVYIDNVVIRNSKASGGGTTSVPKTADEKKSIIDNALETWISGMLAGCKDYVKVWDVVNEPMSDWPDQTQLKTGVGKTLASDEFYWQDYLGKDYAVRAIQLARKYGNADDKLFINDYGLEGIDQKKCKGLIDYISYVESKGVKVDGIGTQMHVTCGQTTLDGVKAMLTNLAATGKLIKISELDMGYRAAGATANMLTDSLKFAQAQEMSVFYQQIVKAYFDIVPAAQRYGITHWSPLDSPKSSSWRAQEPIGLWTEKYYRKPAYGGFADGLAGKAVTTTTP